MSNVAAVKNRTLLHPTARAEILRRIEALSPESERRWNERIADPRVTWRDFSAPFDELMTRCRSAP